MGFYVRSRIRTLLVVVALIVAFWFIPQDAGTVVGAFFAALASTAFAFTVVRAALTNRLQGIDGLVDTGVAITTILFGFAGAYVMLGTTEDFNSNLTHLDALYFSLVTFTTTGFGDIS